MDNRIDDQLRSAHVGIHPNLGCYQILVFIQVAVVVVCMLQNALSVLDSW